MALPGVQVPRTPGELIAPPPMTPGEVGDGPRTPGEDTLGPLLIVGAGVEPIIELPVDELPIEDPVVVPDVLGLPRVGPEMLGAGPTIGAGPAPGVAPKVPVVPEGAPCGVLPPNAELPGVVPKVLGVPRVGPWTLGAGPTIGA